MAYQSPPGPAHLADALAPLLADPRRGAVFCDVDGTLAPIVDHADDARVAPDTSRLLGTIGRRYGCVACISGRPASDARRLVGVGSITYAGMHGAELLEAGAHSAKLSPELVGWEERVLAFLNEHDSPDWRQLRIRAEEKGPIVAFHWRGSPDEDAALERLERVAEAAADRGLNVLWGRKVLEVRPPVELGKGHAVRTLVERCDATFALFAGDDTTDLDGFGALDDLVHEGRLAGAVRVAIRSEEGPTELVERADVVVDTVGGFVRVLEALAA